MINRIMRPVVVIFAVIGSGGDGAVLRRSRTGSHIGGRASAREASR